MHWAERLASRLGVSLADDPGGLERLDAPERVLAILRAAVMARAEVHGDFMNAFERRKLEALSVDPDTFDLRVMRSPGGIPPRLRPSSPSIISPGLRRGRIAAARSS
jgi:hypothetical protein